MRSQAHLITIVVRAPALADGLGGNSATSVFSTRLILIIVIAVYGSIAVSVFDAFWPRAMSGRISIQEQTAPAQATRARDVRE